MKTELDIIISGIRHSSPAMRFHKKEMMLARRNHADDDLIAARAAYNAAARQQYAAELPEREARRIAAQKVRLAAYINPFFAVAHYRASRRLEPSKAPAKH